MAIVLSKSEKQIIAECLYDTWIDDAAEDVPNEVFNILLKLGRKDLAAKITFMEYSSGVYVGKNEQSFQVGSGVPGSSPSQTVFFRSRHSMKIELTLDEVLGGVGKDITILGSATTIE